MFCLLANFKELCSSKDAAAANEEQLSSELSTVSIIFNSVCCCVIDIHASLVISNL